MHQEFLHQKKYFVPIRIWFCCGGTARRCGLTSAIRNKEASFINTVTEGVSDFPMMIFPVALLKSFTRMK